MNSRAIYRGHPWPDSNHEFEAWEMLCVITSHVFIIHAPMSPQNVCQVIPFPMICIAC